MPMPQAKPVYFSGVVADRLEHRGVHHAAAEDLDPAGLLAHRAAGAVALPAADVDFGARLGVREEARAEPQPRPLAEHLAREREQRALQIGERDALRRRPALPSARTSACASGRDRRGGRRGPARRCGSAAGAPACSGSASTRCACAAASAQRRRIAVDRRQRRARGTACPACRARDARPACSARRSSATRPRPPGPSTIAKPMRVKISSMRSRTMVSGWRWPSRGGRPGSVTSTPPAGAAFVRRFLVGAPARLDRLLQLVGVAADVSSSDRAARCRSAASSDGDDAVLAAEVAVADGLRVARATRPPPARARTRRRARRRLRRWEASRT